VEWGAECRGATAAATARDVVLTAFKGFRIKLRGFVKMAVVPRIRDLHAGTMIRSGDRRLSVDDVAINTSDRYRRMLTSGRIFGARR
jgi:hypothetical protein